LLLRRTYLSVSRRSLPLSYSAEVTHISPTIAVHTGRFLNGITWDTTTKLPVKIPALPSPAMDRPIISVMELGEMPQIKEPTRKKPRETRYDHFILKSMKMRP
jgi:hypothetical protein